MKSKTRLYWWQVIKQNTFRSAWSTILSKMFSFTEAENTSTKGGKVHFPALENIFFFCTHESVLVGDMNFPLLGTESSFPLYVYQHTITITKEYLSKYPDRHSMCTSLRLRPRVCTHLVCVSGYVEIYYFWFIPFFMTEWAVVAVFIFLLLHQRIGANGDDCPYSNVDWNVLHTKCN